VLEPWVNAKSSFNDAKNRSLMKIVFKSEEFAELNFVREYPDGFNVDEKSEIGESAGERYYLKKPESYSVEIELSLDFIRKVFHNDLEILREFGQNIGKNYPGIMGNQAFPITNAMKQILTQVRECQYTGPLKRMFVEAKVIELLTLQISQINSFQTKKTTLKKADIDKLNEVKELLLKNLNSPYSIDELARVAGINRTKLQDGFKDLFGTTIFGYITDIRLEDARRHIMDSGHNKTIAEIATMSGYKNAQHFTAAFKRKYGYLPKELKK
jgi:AraC family transcriptional activator of pyochelin receptor